MMFSFVFSGGVNEPTVAEMEEIMDELDKDGDGKLNLSGIHLYNMCFLL